MNEGVNCHSSAFAQIHLTPSTSLCASSGLNWRRLGRTISKNCNNAFFETDCTKPDEYVGQDMIRQTLSVVYDPNSNGGTVYIGTQSSGIARLEGLQGAIDSGYVDLVDALEWTWMNEGLGDVAGGLVVPELRLVKGKLYSLLSGDAPKFSNHEVTGMYVLDETTLSWKKLRGTVAHPPEVGSQFTMLVYPTSFDVDPITGTLWMVDYNANLNYLASGIWRSTDNGDNWTRLLQVTHPYQIRVVGSRVYVSSSWTISRWGYASPDGSWGYGGMLHSDDGGETWSRNQHIPLLANGQSVTIDPQDTSQLFYTFFGGGMLKGPVPAGQGRTISGSVLENTNTGIAGVLVELYHFTNGSFVSATTTDNNGKFSFFSVARGFYTVVQINSEGFGDVRDSDNGNPNVMTVDISSADSFENFFFDMRVSMVPSESFSPSLNSVPSSAPSPSPSAIPSPSPSDYPSLVPSLSPSDNPTGIPSSTPTGIPTASPSHLPSLIPSSEPSRKHSEGPSLSPSEVPSVDLSPVPTSQGPSLKPSYHPSRPAPSAVPSRSPSAIPSVNPTAPPVKTAPALVGPPVGSTSSPSADGDSCDDNTSYTFTDINNRTRYCFWLHGKKSRQKKYCTGDTMLLECEESCGQTCSDNCVDSKNKFNLGNKKNKSCSWIATKGLVSKYCSKEYASFLECPDLCDTCDSRMKTCYDDATATFTVSAAPGKKAKARDCAWVLKQNSSKKPFICSQNNVDILCPHACEACKTDILMSDGEQ